ncbi:DUF4347 domain-containing protein [Magnetovibrio sp. PR-2]|uniref:DUF4347 domain-containing protein n=1 Tax=Magnetovibrio sp. PR-2 TaxID=3120356 RepID=UPI002FCDFF32
MNKIVASYIRKHMRATHADEIVSNTSKLGAEAAWPSRAPMALALEPRFMFDAAGGATGAQVAEQTAAESVASQNNDQDENLAQAVSSGQNDAARNEVVVIDSSIADYQTLLDGVDPSLDVILLEPGADVNDLAQALSGYSSVDAVHLITHGETGALNFSGGALTLDNLEDSQDALLTIGDALSADGDLLLYGCNVGADGAGQDFIDALATATGADIAASDDLTGSADLGGDWDLEASSGIIETDTALDDETAVYDGLLLTDTIEYAYATPSNSTTGAQIAQSFTATQTGTLTSVSFLLITQPTSDVTVSIYSGEAVSGTALASQVWAKADATAAGSTADMRTLTFSSPASITSGSTYTIAFGSGDTSIGIYRYNSGTDNYSGGKPYLSGGFVASGYDFFFKATQTYTSGPTVSDGNISITSSGSGTGGAYKVGDTITASWNNTAGGDNNSGITGVTMDFSAFGGGAAVAATDSSDTWTASYTLTSGSVDGTNLNVSVTATDGTAATTADTSNLTADNQAPTVTDGNISISGASGTGGAYKVGDTVTATWNNTAGGDNNSDTISSATVDFSAFGGGGSVAASNSSGTWTATYTITAGAIDATSRNISFTATDNAGNTTTTADSTNATVDSVAPTVTDGNISISGASGTGGAYKIGDTVTATWNNTAGGDNNTDTISGVTVDFSQFGGGAAVAASNSSGTWTATYTIVAGAVDTTSRNVSVTATDNAGNTTTTADSTNATVDSVAPTVTDGNISISGASGTGGAFKTGDTVTATWNNTAGGDNNSDTISSATVDFSAFGGGAAVAASNSSGTWTATYTITAGAIDSTNLNVSVTATDNAGNTTTTADSTNATVDNTAPTVSDGNLSISGASGTGGAFKVGDTVTATWNNTAGGDNNSDTISGVTVNFSGFGGGAAVAASNSTGTWTATYTITAGAIDGTNVNVSATATDNAGNTTTTADTTNATVDSVNPTVSDGNISVTSSGSGTGGAYVVGDTITVAWNNTAGGDNNSDTISGVTVNFSAFGGGAAVAASNSSGTWSASYTVVTGSTKGSNLNASVTATDNAGNTTTTADTSNLSIVNSAPVASGTYSFSSINEDTTATGVTVSTVVAGLTTSDADSNTLGVAVTGTSGNGTWQFSHDSTNGTDGTWTSFASGNTPAAATSLLLAPAAYVRYVPDSQNAETATMTVRGWDQTAGTASSGTTARYADTSTNGNATPYSSGTATGSQAVTAVNDVPVVDLDASAGGVTYSTSFSAGGSTVTIANTDATYSDVDTSDSQASLTATLTSRPDGDSVESLALNSTATTAATNAGLTVGYTSGTGVLSITGAASTSVYQTILRGIVYNNTDAAADITTGNRTVNVVGNDGDGNSSTAAATVSVVTAPVTDLNGATSGTGVTVAFTEGDGATTIASAATVTEPDGDNLNQFVVTLTNAQTGDILKVGVRNNGDVVNGITVTETSASVITLSGSATAANYQALIREITFNNTSEAPSTTARTITFAGRDVNSNTGASATATINVSAVNDSPAFAGLDATPNPNENVAVQLDANATLSDAELDAGNNYNGATLTLSRNGGASANDTFAHTGTLSTMTQGGNLTVGGTTIGTVTTNSSGTLLLTFNSSATSALVDSALQQITYANSSNTESGNVQIDYSFSDGTTISQGSGGAKTATGSVTVTVAAVNDTPTMTGLDATPSFTKGGSAVVLDANVVLADAELDNGNNYNGATLQIVRNGGASANDQFAGSGTLYGAADNATLTQGGALKVGTTSIGTVTTNSGGTLLLTFNASATSALVDSAIQQIAYSAATAEAAGNKQLDWTFSDGTTVAQGSGGAKTATGNVTVTVANAAPVVSGIGGSSVSATPTTAVNIDAGADAAITDADSTHFNGGNVSLTKVGTVPATANFTVDGTNVTSTSGGGVLAGGDTISVGGTAIGTVDNTDTGQGGNSLKITFNSTNATPARIATLLQNLKFQAGSAGNAVFDITVTDAAGGTTSTAARVTVSATNPTTTTTNNLNVSQIAPTPPAGDGGGDGGGEGGFGGEGDGGGDGGNEGGIDGPGGDTGGDAGGDAVGGAGGGLTLADPNATPGYTYGGDTPGNENTIINRLVEGNRSGNGNGNTNNDGPGGRGNSGLSGFGNIGGGGLGGLGGGIGGGLGGGIGGGLGGGIGGGFGSLGGAAGGGAGGGATGGGIGGGLGGGATGGAPGGGLGVGVTGGGAPGGGLGGGATGGGATGGGIGGGLGVGAAGGGAPGGGLGGGATGGNAGGTGAAPAGGGAPAGVGGVGGASASGGDGGQPAAGGQGGAGGDQGPAGQGQPGAGDGAQGQDGQGQSGQGQDGQGQSGQGQDGQGQDGQGQSGEGQSGEGQGAQPPAQGGEGQGGQPPAQGGDAGQGGEPQGQDNQGQDNQGQDGQGNENGQGQGQGQGEAGAQEGAFFQPGGRTSFTDQLAAAAQTQQSSLDKLVEAMERLAS